jgi:hypothetical protein
MSTSANEQQLRGMLEANGNICNSNNGDFPALNNNNMINHDDYANVFYKGWILTSKKHINLSEY